MDTVYSLEVWVADGERWRWSAIGAYPTLDMAVAVGEGFLSVKPYRVRRVTDVGDGFHDFLAEEGVILLADAPRRCLHLVEVAVEVHHLVALPSVQQLVYREFEVVWDLERQFVGSQYTSRVHATVPPFT